MISDFYPPFIGGMYRYVQTLSRALVKRGHEVVVCTSGNKYLDSCEEDQGVKVIRFEGFFQKIPFLFKDLNEKHPPPFQDFLVSQKLRRIIRREKPDIIHCHGWILYSVLPLKKEIEVPLVVTIHSYGYLCPKKSLLNKNKICVEPPMISCISCAKNQYGWVKSLFTCYGLRLNKERLKLVDQFIAVSHFVKDFYSKHLILGDRVLVIPNFYESKKDTFRSKEPGTLPEDFILFVGGLSPHKGVDVLIEAYDKLNTKTKLLIIGKTYPPHCYKSTENIMIIENAPYKTVMEAYSKCRFMVIPSIWPDPCPTVAFEAMSWKKGLIASNIGGLRDIIVNGKTGILITPNNSKKLSEAMDYLLKTPSIANEMGENGFKRFIRYYTSDVITSKIENIYKDLCAR